MVASQHFFNSQPGIGLHCEGLVQCVYLLPSFCYDSLCVRSGTRVGTFLPEGGKNVFSMVKTGLAKNFLPAKIVFCWQK